jgi:O-6-methylguanine DNA methyltransferase
MPKSNSNKLGFTQKVHRVVKLIPKGLTLTYKQVAKLAGRPRAYRAVGNILNKNFDPTIPCHRVIRSDGKPGGYNRGTTKKIKILKSEKASFRK